MARKKGSIRFPKLRHHKPTGQGCVELSGKFTTLESMARQSAKPTIKTSWLSGSRLARKPLVAMTPPSNAAAGLTIYEVCERFLDYGNCLLRTRWQTNTQR